MTEKIFPADTSVLDDVIAFAEEELEQAKCPLQTVMPLTLALEEMFVNIAHYAYPNGTGSVRLAIGYDPKTHTITFRLTDNGIPFNPLAHRDPDLTLPAEQRPIGGLGIYMMKQTMDRVSYRYESGKNVLTMQKRLS